MYVHCKIYNDSKMQLMSSLYGSCISNSNCYSSISVLPGWDWWVLIRTINTLHHDLIIRMDKEGHRLTNCSSLNLIIRKQHSVRLHGGEGEGIQSVHCTYIGLKDSLSNHPPCYISVILSTDVQQHDTVKAKEFCNTTYSSWNWRISHSCQ